MLTYNVCDDLGVCCNVVGAMISCIQAVKSSLLQLQETYGDKCQVGIVTFSSDISFYHLRPTANYQISVFLF